uniref:Uncharacterized protein n=1 Tax=Arundo donax TaxID=35708 RepID=A0A0A9FE94_ARUDO
MLETLGYKRQLKVKIPVPVIMPMAYVVCWIHKTLFRYQLSQSLIFTPATIKYATQNRTFSCKKATISLVTNPLCR